MGKLEDMAAAAASLSDEDLLTRIQEIRKSRNIRRPAAVTHEAKTKRTDKLKKLLTGLSKEDLAKLLSKGK